MIQRRPTPKSTVSMIIVAVALCFIARTAIKDLLYVLHKKEAIGRVISYNVPNPQHPTTYLVTTRFLNEYKHDSADLNVWLKNYHGKIPGYLKLHYDGKNEIYADDQPQPTWATVMWKSLVGLLLLLYVAMELTTFTIDNRKER